jgi:Short C-terminal domain
MPGLLRGMARTAAVAGTATAVSNRVSRRQANRWAEQGGTLPRGYAYGANVEAPDAPPPPPDAYAPEPEVDPIQRLRELGKLRDDGILTEEEFAAEKQKILG